MCIETKHKLLPPKINFPLYEKYIRNKNITDNMLINLYKNKNFDKYKEI